MIQPRQDPDRTNRHNTNPHLCGTPIITLIAVMSTREWTTVSVFQHADGSLSADPSAMTAWETVCSYWRIFPTGICRHWLSRGMYEAYDDFVEVLVGATKCCVVLESSEISLYILCYKIHSFNPSRSLSRNFPLKTSCDAPIWRLKAHSTSTQKLSTILLQYLQPHRHHISTTAMMCTRGTRV